MLELEGMVGKEKGDSTMAQNREKNRKVSHEIIHCPTSKETSEVSERVNEWTSESMSEWRMTYDVPIERKSESVCVRWKKEGQRWIAFFKEKRNFEALN